MRIEDFGPVHLSRYSHSGPHEGMCFMEMVSFISGGAWTDKPECACPVLAEYGRALNDGWMNQADRDRLQELVPFMIGTRDPDREHDRATALVRSVATVLLPRYLRHYKAERLACQFEENSELDSLLELMHTTLIGKTMGDVQCSSVLSAIDIVRHSLRSVQRSDIMNAISNIVLLPRRANHCVLVIPAKVTVAEFRKVIEMGAHGEGYTDIHQDRAAELRRVLVTV